MLICGINPVSEALRAGRVLEVLATARQSGRVASLVREAQRSGVIVRVVAEAELDRAAHGHQGVVAELVDEPRATIQELVGPRDHHPPLIVVLDGVEDPHNVGAILRTADAAGATGVVRQRRHSARLGAGAAKASAGALAHVRIVDVVNISRAIEELKAAGIWTVGLAGEASMPYTAIDFTLPTAIVVGSEEQGLRRLVRAHCDWVVSIPMAGQVASLNVSVATGVALFEAVRQRGRDVGENTREGPPVDGPARQRT